jgi:hypothetical protein
MHYWQPDFCSERCDVMYQQIADESYEIVKRYDARLQSLGCNGVASAEKTRTSPTRTTAATGQSA